MNIQRRKRLTELHKQLSTILHDIESVKEDEQEAYDNLPESFQNGERGSEMQECISKLDDVESSINLALDDLSEFAL